MSETQKVIPARAIALRAASDGEKNAGTVREVGGNNRGPAIDFYKTLVGWPADSVIPWCAAFACSRYLLADQRLDAEGPDVTLPAHFPRSAACAAYKQWAKRRRLWLPVGQVKAGIRSPRRGDMAIFDWDDHPGKDHCGIVLSFNARTMRVETVEGNTKPGNGVSRESNSGDGVFEKDRGLGAFGIGGGFVLIDF